MLVLIAGLRYGIGGDTLQYMEDWKNLYKGGLSHVTKCITTTFDKKGYMPLWVLLNSAIRQFTDSFYVLQFAQALIVNLLICYVAHRHTRYLFLFLILYLLSGNFFMFNTEVMREGPAIAFVLCGAEWLMRETTKPQQAIRNLLLFFIFVFIGMMFHLSAVVGLLFLLTKWPIAINRRTLMGSVVTAFILWGASTTLMLVALHFSSVLPESFVTKLQHYAMISSSFFGFVRNMLTYVLLPGIVGYYAVLWEENATEQERKKRMVRFMLIMGILASGIDGIRRFNNYLQIYYMILLADYLFFLFKKSSHLVIRVGTTVMITVMIVWGYFAYWPKAHGYMYEWYVPYTSIVDEDYNLTHRIQLHDAAVSRQTSDKKAIRQK